MITFHQRENIERLVSKTGVDESMLTAYFIANRNTRKTRISCIMTFLNSSLGNQMGNSGNQGNMAQVDRLVEWSQHILLRGNTTICVFS
jgi:hypothetical protein